MRQHRIVGRCIVVGFGVVAVAYACYLIFGNQFDAIWCAIWGPWPLVSKAEKCLERGDYDSALEFANRAVQCRPDMEVTYNVRAEVLETRGDFGKAVQDYTKLISLRKYLAHADRGRAYEKMGLFDKAAADYCEALRSARGDVRFVALRRVMGPGEHGVERYPDAVPSLLKFINEAIKREPDNRDLRECRELILQSEGGKEEK